MILSLSNQAYIFLITILIGLIIGIVYDVFRLIRKIFVHKNIVVYIEDIIFGIISTFICFYVLLHKNNLELRAYLVVAIALGIIFYFACISYFVMKIVYVLVKPISLLIQLIINIFKPFIKSYKFCRNKMIYKRKNYLQKVVRYVKIKHKGFSETIKVILRKI